MSNLKISQLPSYTGNTSGSWLVMNNSGETTTYKVQRENLLSGFQPSGNYATTGSNTFNGNQTINGYIDVRNNAANLISGSAVSLQSDTQTAIISKGSGTNFISSSVSTKIVSTNIFITGSITQTGSLDVRGRYNQISATLGNYISSNVLGAGYNVIEARQGFNQISGSYNIIQGDNRLTGSLISSGSSHKFIGPTEITGTTTVTGYLNVKENAGAGVGQITLSTNNNSSSLSSYVTSYNSELILKSTLSGSLGQSIISLKSFEPTGSRYNGVSFYQQTGSFIMYEEFPGSGGGTSFNPVLILKNSVSPSTITTLQIPRNTEITGSVNVTNKLNLKAQNPLPSGVLGDLAVSSSNALYFHNGTSWSLIS